MPCRKQGGPAASPGLLPFLIFKAVLCGGLKISNGVEIIVSERFRDSTLSLKRFRDLLFSSLCSSDAKISPLLSVGSTVWMVPANNDKIWSLLGEMTAEVPLQEAIVAAVTSTVTWALRETVIALMVVLDMGHVTLMASEFADMQTAAIVSTKYRKRDSLLITF